MNRLEILVEREISVGILARLLSRRRRALLLLLELLRAGHHARLLVVADTLLEEVRLTREGNVLHEVKGVGGIVHLAVAESQEQAVGDELNVLAHEGGVHAEQCAGQSLGQEFLLNGNGFGDDGADGLVAGTRLQEGEEQASEVGVHTLVARDELVGEGQAGHETALLQPEDGREGSAEEDSLDGGERDEAVGEGRVLVGDPAEGPVGLLADAGNYDALDAFILV